MICAALVAGAAAGSLRAATGDLLLQLQSSTGRTPENQGWTHEGRCLGPGCPGSVNNPPCYFQGARDLNYDLMPDNTCLIGIGCHKYNEHYNSPEANEGITGSCSYTEWIAFDNGVNTWPRALTIADSTISHSPPWGAPYFLRAPTYPVLRVVTGDGNNTPGTLPASGTNYRNRGRVEIRKPYTLGQGVGAVTLICKVAAGPRSGEDEFISIRTNNRVFTFGLEGNPVHPDFGRVTYGENSASNLGVLFSQTVQVAMPGAPGPHSGEFFTLRAILRSNGTVIAFLNEDLSTAVNVTTTSTSGGASPQVSLTPDENDATMWFDFVRLYEGEIYLACPTPRFDANQDGRVDSSDFDAFIRCATPPGVSDALAPGCRCLDGDSDGDVDMVDFAALQRCLSVNGVAISADCQN